MSRVFLVSANTTVEPYPVYPLGMSLVAGALAARGHEVRQFDLLAAGQDLERLGRELAAFAPAAVGISLRNIDNVDSFAGESGWYLETARQLTAAIRAATAVPIFIGGAGFTLMPEAILDFLGADHGVVGEGEGLAVALVEALAAGRPVPRLLRTEGPGLDGAGFATPLLEPRAVDFYLGETGLVNFQTKRGCPHHCAYCTYPLIEGNRYRPRDPAAVAEDLRRLQRDHGVERVFFTDSVFNDLAGHHLLVAEELIRRELGLRWGGIFRPQRTGRAELALLKRAGLYAMELGTDAAADLTLAGLEKGFTFAEVAAFNRAAVAEEIPAAHFIMFGGPGETADTVREGLENIARLERCVVFAFSGIRILPGTGIHRRAIAEGVIAADTPLLHPVYYFAPGLDVAAMNAAIDGAFRKRRDRIFPPAAGKERMAVMQRFGYRGLLWDRLISFEQ